eukprot:GHVU01027255.1.p1 GENE.GHVU01027255.1~~GHVU01027255.1.p1  ORF type:complete len:215 (-),score=30.23 GHVU01027255.1:159-803(-)
MGNAQGIQSIYDLECGWCVSRTGRARSIVPTNIEGRAPLFSKSTSPGKDGRDYVTPGRSLRAQGMRRPSVSDTREFTEQDLSSHGDPGSDAEEEDENSSAVALLRKKTKSLLDALRKKAVNPTPMGTKTVTVIVDMKKVAWHPMKYDGTVIPKSIGYAEHANVKKVEAKPDDSKGINLVYQEPGMSPVTISFIFDSPGVRQEWQEAHRQLLQLL